MKKTRLLILFLALVFIIAALAQSDIFAEEDMLREPVEGCDMRGVCEHTLQFTDEQYQAWYKSQGFE